MKKAAVCIVTCISFMHVYSQNSVGINTTNPQATLDVRGGQRIGGNLNYMHFDSATGRIQWIASQLYVPSSQHLIRHSASTEGLYAGGGKLEYRNTTEPVFFSDWTNGNGYFKNNLGIGTTNPAARLDVAGGNWDLTGSEGDMRIGNNAYRIKFGIATGGGGAGDAGIMQYGQPGGYNVLSLGSQGNKILYVVGSSSRIGIGTDNPTEKLEVIGNIKANGLVYNTPRTSYYSISPIDFSSSVNPQEVVKHSSFAYLIAGSTGQLVAPVHLPHNAVITEFKVYLQDWEPSCDLSASLEYSEHSGGFVSNIASVSTLGAPGLVALVDNTIQLGPMANNVGSLSIYITASSPWTGGNFYFRGAVITYTVSGPE